MQKNFPQKNETVTENQPESHEYHDKYEDMASPYNIQENKSPHQRSQNSNKQENIPHKQKSPKDRKRIKTPEFLKIIQRYTNFPAIYVLIPIVSCGLFVLFGSFEIFFTNLMGLVFPIYWTMRAFNDLNEKDEEKQWYSYWLIYLSMIPIDLLFGRFLRHIPLFYFAKYLFLCWMFLPNFKGASYIHDILIKKRFPDFDIVHRIDQSSEKIRHHFRDFTGRIQSRFFERHLQEAEHARKHRIKKHERPSMDKPADLRNTKEESRNIDEEIDKIKFEPEDKEKDKDKNKKESKDQQDQISETKKIDEQKEKPKEITLKEVLERKDKEAKPSEEEHHEHLKTNESETYKGQEASKDSDAYKNIVSKISEKIKPGEGDTKEKIYSSIENLWDKMKEGEQPEKNKEQIDINKSENKKEEAIPKQSDFGVTKEDKQTGKSFDKSEEEMHRGKPESGKIITEKPFKDSKEKRIEPEKPFKKEKKMPEVDIENLNDENKENIRRENISQRTEKKKDAKAAHVSEKDSEKKKESEISSGKKETQMMKQ